MRFLAFVLVSGLSLMVMVGCSKESSVSQKAGDSSMAMSPTTAPTTSSDMVMYTCTMHPDVTSDKPGKCPKCGMDLVLKK